MLLYILKVIAKNAYGNWLCGRARYNSKNSQKNYCKNLTSSLLAFNDKLIEIKDAWTTSTSNLAATITDDSSKTDEGTAYSPTHGTPPAGGGSA